MQWVNRLTGIGLLLVLAGCSKTTPEVSMTKPIASAPVTPPTTPTLSKEDEEVRKERAKLNAEDLALVEAQEWCVNNTDERLGEMGAPIKLTIKGKPVFICCAGCRKAVEADPEKTLAKVEELKSLKKAGKKPQ